MLGVFPYTWSKSSPPRPLNFNLCLGLWVVCMKFLSGGLSLLVLSKGLSDLKNETLGRAVLKLSSLTFVFGFHIAVFFLTAQSRSLARILHEFDLCIPSMMKKKKLISYLKVNKANNAYWIITLISLVLYAFDTLGLHKESTYEVAFVYALVWYHIYIEIVMLLVFFLFTASLEILLEVLEKGVEEAKENELDFRSTGRGHVAGNGSPDRFFSCSSDRYITHRLQRLSRIVGKVNVYLYTYLYTS